MRGFFGLWAIGLLCFGVNANLAIAQADDFGPRFQNTPYIALMDDMAADLQNIEPAAGENYDVNADFGGYIDIPEAVIENDQMINSDFDQAAPIAL